MDTAGRRRPTHRADVPVGDGPVLRSGPSAATAPADAVPSIRVRDLEVRRGKQPVLTDLDCAILPGRVTGLLGPSGAGKATLMRAIVGTPTIASGSVEVLGTPAGSASLRRRVGYVTQAPSIYRDIPVRDNLRYFARIVGAPTARIPEVIAAVGLEGYESRLAGKLSGGQTSRVSLACVLVGSPDVLVLDEPTVGQDPVLREELWDRIRERTSGTLERLMTTPITPWGLIGAYALAFGVLATLQVAIQVTWCLLVLDLDLDGPVLGVLLVGVVNALMGVALGLFASAFARTEFQAVEMFPVLVIPQILLCGLFGPRDQMAGWLQPIADLMPLRYSVEALEEIATNTGLTRTYWVDVVIVAAVTIGILVLASLTLRRRSG